MRAQRPWYQERSVWAFIALRFAPLLAILNLAWEIAQLPLYTIWYEAEGPDIAFAVAHCTAGDVLLGTFALTLALTATGAGPLIAWRTVHVAAITIALSVSYTVFSEWMNTVVRNGWAYSNLMPLLPGSETGLSPLLQWAVIPPVALYVALRLNGARQVRMEPAGKPLQKHALQPQPALHDIDELVLRQAPPGGRRKLVILGQPVKRKCGFRQPVALGAEFLPVNEGKRIAVKRAAVRESSKQCSGSILHPGIISARRGDFADSGCRTMGFKKHTGLDGQIGLTAGGSLHGLPHRLSLKVGIWRVLRRSSPLGYTFPLSLWKARKEMREVGGDVGIQSTEY